MRLDEIHIRDPFILTDGGKYYMYGTGKHTGGLGFDVYTSDDLVSWSEPREDWPAYRQMCLEGYCAALYGMDKGVGQLLDALEELHLRENTLVIFTGDNGMCVGQHGVIGKGNGTFPMNMYASPLRPDPLALI